MTTARRLVLGLAWACLASVGVFAQGPVPTIATPNLQLFPGSTNPKVTQANIKTTICKSGWTATIRPPTSYTNALKKAQEHTLGYETANPLPKVKSASGKTMRPDLTKSSSRKPCARLRTAVGDVCRQIARRAQKAPVILVISSSN